MKINKKISKINSMNHIDKNYIRIIHKEIFTNITKCSESHSKKCNVCNGGYMIVNEIHYHIKNGKSLSEALYIIKNIKKDINISIYINKYGIPSNTIQTYFHW